MNSKNIDVSVDTMAMLDSIVEFFDGKYNSDTILNMDIPLLKSLLLGRADNIKKATEKMINDQKTTAHAANKIRGLTR